MADRKGFLIYFDTRNAWQILTNEQRGNLLMSIMDYSEYGVIPEFSDKLLEMAWALMRPKLDRDADSYAERCRKNSYSVYCREEKKKGIEPLEYESWLQNRDNHSISNDIKEHPTITETIKETIIKNETETEKECKGKGKTGNQFVSMNSDCFRAEPAENSSAPANTATDYRSQTDQEFEELREIGMRMLGLG